MGWNLRKRFNNETHRSPSKLWTQTAALTRKNWCVRRRRC
jgi:hypothetical protein